MTVQSSKANKQPRGLGPKQGESSRSGKSRTPGFILERVGRYREDGVLRDAAELHDQIKHHDWYPQSRFLGFARGFALFERPDPGALRATIEAPNPIGELEKFREVG